MTGEGSFYAPERHLPLGIHKSIWSKKPWAVWIATVAHDAIGSVRNESKDGRALCVRWSRCRVVKRSTSHISSSRAFTFASADSFCEIDVSFV